MDPDANIREQLALARALVTEEERDSSDQATDADRLAELVLALDEWRRKDGYDPYARKANEAQREFFDRAVANMTGEQALRVLRRLRPWDPTPRLLWEPFDQPPGFVEATYADGFSCGIEPDGGSNS